MRKLILCLIVFAAQSWGALSVVCTSGTGIGSNNPVLTGDINSTGAFLLTVQSTDFSINPAAGPDSIVDNKGNSFHFSVGVAAGNLVSPGIAYAWDHGGSPLSLGSGHHITYTGDYPGVTFCAWSGYSAYVADPWDNTQHNSAEAASASGVTTSLTPVSNANGSLLITTLGMGADSTTQSISGWTIMVTSHYLGSQAMFSSSAYKVQTGAPASETAAWVNGITTDCTTVVTSFKLSTPTGGAGPTGSFVVW